MHGAVGLGVILALMGCVATVPAQKPDESGTLPPGYPPKIGVISAELAGKAAGWETYDYSIGAFDASAQFSGPKAAPMFRMLGLPPGQPSSTTNRITMAGNAPGGAKAGPLAKPLIEIVAGTNWDGLRLSSSGQQAEIVVDTLTPKDSGYGHATGHFSAIVCAANDMPIKVDTRHCQPLTGTFETDLQFDLN